jgi:hypothetical protein
MLLSMTIITDFGKALPGCLAAPKMLFDSLPLAVVK